MILKCRLQLVLYIDILLLFCKLKNHHFVHFQASFITTTQATSRMTSGTSDPLTSTTALTSTKESTSVSSQSSLSSQRKSHLPILSETKLALGYYDQNYI